MLFPASFAALGSAFCRNGRASGDHQYLYESPCPSPLPKRHPSPIPCPWFSPPPLLPLNDGTKLNSIASDQPQQTCTESVARLRTKAELRAAVKPGLSHQDAADQIRTVSVFKELLSVPSIFDRWSLRTPLLLPSMEGAFSKAATPVPRRRVPKPCRSLSLSDRMKGILTASDQPQQNHRVVTDAARMRFYPMSGASDVATDVLSKALFSNSRPKCAFEAELAKLAFNQRDATSEASSSKLFPQDASPLTEANLPSQIIDSVDGDLEDAVDALQPSLLTKVHRLRQAIGDADGALADSVINGFQPSFILTELFLVRQAIDNLVESFQPSSCDFFHLRLAIDSAYDIDAAKSVTETPATSERLQPSLLTKVRRLRRAIRYADGALADPVNGFQPSFMITELFLVRQAIDNLVESPQPPSRAELFDLTLAASERLHEILQAWSVASIANSSSAWTGDTDATSCRYDSDIFSNASEVPAAIEHGPSHQDLSDRIRTMVVTTGRLLVMNVDNSQRWLMYLPSCVVARWDVSPFRLTKVTEEYNMSDGEVEPENVGRRILKCNLQDVGSTECMLQVLSNVVRAEPEGVEFNCGVTLNTFINLAHVPHLSWYRKEHGSDVWHRLPSGRFFVLNDKIACSIRVDGFCDLFVGVEIGRLDRTVAFEPWTQSDPISPPRRQCKLLVYQQSCPHCCDRAEAHRIELENSEFEPNVQPNAGPILNLHDGDSYEVQDPKSLLFKVSALSLVHLPPEMQAYKTAEWLLDKFVAADIEQKYLDVAVAWSYDNGVSAMDFTGESAEVLNEMVLVVQEAGLGRFACKRLRSILSSFVGHISWIFHHRDPPIVKDIYVDLAAGGEISRIVVSKRNSVCVDKCELRFRAPIDTAAVTVIRSRAGERLDYQSEEIKTFEQEYRDLLDVIEVPDIDVVIPLNTSLFLDQMTAHRTELLVLSGHGYPHGFLLSGRVGRTGHSVNVDTLLSPDQLQRLLTQAMGAGVPLRCILLNCCDGRKLASAARCAGVPTCVFWDGEKTNDEMVHKFTKSFANWAKLSVNDGEEQYYKAFMLSRGELSGDHRIFQHCAVPKVFHGSAIEH